MQGDLRHPALCLPIFYLDTAVRPPPHSKGSHPALTNDTPHVNAVLKKPSRLPGAESAIGMRLTRILTWDRRIIDKQLQTLDINGLQRGNWGLV